jgi:hypothetical protein
MSEDRAAPARRYTAEEIAAEVETGRVRWTQRHDEARAGVVPGSVATSRPIGLPRNRAQRDRAQRAAEALAGLVDG